MMYDFSNVTDISKGSKDAWLRLNRQAITATYGEDASDEDITSAFHNSYFKHLYSKRSDYDRLKKLDRGTRERILLGELSPEEALSSNNNDNRLPEVDFEKVLNTDDKVSSEHEHYLAQNRFLNNPQAEAKASIQRYNQAFETWNRRFNMSAVEAFNNIEAVKKVAAQTSPHYKYYEGSDYLTLNKEDWKDITLQYRTLLDSQGEAEANNYLEQEIAKNVASNMGPLQKLYRGFKGIGVSAYGGAIGALGMIQGAYNAITGDYHKEGMNWFQNTISAMVDSGLSRYGSDVVRYGTIWTDRIQELKETSGISDNAIEYAGQSGWRPDNLLADALASQGFTVATMGYNAALTKGTGWVLGKIAQKTLAKAAAKGSIYAARHTLKNLRTIEKAANWFTVLTMGTNEGIVNAVDTKEAIIEEELAKLNQLHEQKASINVEEALQDYNPIIQDITAPDGSKATKTLYKHKETGEIRTIEDIYYDAYNKDIDAYKQSREEIEFAASEAAVGDFTVNSFINGFANGVLKLAIWNPYTRNLLKKSKLLNHNSFTTTGEGANTNVSVRTPAWVNTAVAVGREPLSEMWEEGSQNVSSDVWQAVAKNNIENWVTNRYNGNTALVVGQHFGDQLEVAWNAFSESVQSEETFRSAVLGGIGSMLGVPGVYSRKARTGNYIRTSDGKLVAETVRFGRGLKEDGTKENFFEAFARAAPWQSPVMEEYRRAKSEREVLQARANQIQSLLRDPEAMKKFKDINSFMAWAESMQKSAETGDEYNYRNSQLGALISQVNLLNDLQGTEVHNTWMELITNMASMQEGSDEAKKAVREVLEDLNSDYLMSTSADRQTAEHEIFTRIQENAQKVLKTINDINEESENIESELGLTDQDVKGALIYNRLASEDWEKRERELLLEIEELKPKIVNSTGSSVILTPEQRATIMEYGSIANVNSRRAKIDEDINRNRKALEQLERVKDKSPRQRSRIAEIRNKLNDLALEGRKLDDLVNNLPTISFDLIGEEGTTTHTQVIDDSDIVLNESDIMHMDPAERFKFLLKGLGNFYNTVNGENKSAEFKSPYSQEQQAVLESLKRQLKQEGLNKLMDVGRIHIAREEGDKRYMEVLADRSQLLSFINTQKQQAANLVLKEKYKYLLDIQDYNKFKEELDGLWKTAPLRDRIIANDLLEANENYKRYNQQKANKSKLTNQILADRAFTEKLSSNDTQLVDVITDFLISNDIDISDENAVTQALGKMENGNSAIVNYVTKYNEGRDQALTLDNIATLVGKYKEAAHRIKLNEENKAKVEAAPIETSGNSVPARHAQVNTNTPQDNKSDADTETKVEKPTTENPTEKQENKPQPQEKSKEKKESPEEVITTDYDRKFVKAKKEKILNKIRNAINNTNSFLSHFGINYNEVKSQYEEIERNGDFENKSIDEILDYLTSKTKDRSLDGNLRENLSKAINDVRASMGTIEQQVEKELKESSKKVITDNGRAGMDLKDPIRSLPKGHPIRVFFERTDSQRFINDGEAVNHREITSGLLGKKRRVDYPLYYYYDSELANSMAQNVEGYSVEQLPIIAMYKIPKELQEKYPNSITIESPITGVKDKYMPVGILVDNNEDSVGVSQSRSIRSNVGNTNDSHLLTKNNKLIQSNFKIDSPRLDEHSNARDVLADANSMALQAMDDAEREATENNKVLDEKDKKDIGRKAIQTFIDKLWRRSEKIQVLTKYNTKESRLVYQLRTLQNNDKVTNHLFLEKPLGQVVNEKGDTILQAFNNGTLGENFNQYTIDFISALQKFINNAIENGINLNNIDNKKLNSLLNNHLYTKGEYAIKADGLGFSFYLKDKKLGSIHNGQEVAVEADGIIKNLFIDNNELNTKVHFQLDYGKMTGDYGKKLFERAVFNGVILNTITDSTWERSNRTVNVTSTENLGRETIPTERPVADGHPIQPITPSGQIDPQTGNDNTGNPPKNPVKPLFESACNIVKNIVNNAAHLVREGEEGGYYQSKDKTTLFERVTHLIRDKVEDYNGPYKIPSTNIGTTIDNFTRRFFEYANSINKKILSNEDIEKEFTETVDAKTGMSYIKDSKGTVYYNFTISQMKEFANQLISLQRYFDRRGLTVFPNDITLSGNVTIGNFNYNVAGTLDILAVDDEGNFYIFDMKTHRWDPNSPYFEDNSITNLEHYSEKWNRQLSLYKYLLEQFYLKGTNHKVVECGIIPISVDYIGSSDINTFTENSETNELTLNGNPYFANKVSLDLSEDIDTAGYPIFRPIPITGDAFRGDGIHDENNYNKEVLKAAQQKREATEDEKNPPKRKPLIRGKGYGEHSNKEIHNENKGKKTLWKLLNKKVKDLLRDEAKKRGSSITVQALQEEWENMTAEEQQKKIDCAMGN